MHFLSLFSFVINSKERQQADSFLWLFWKPPSTITWIFGILLRDAYDLILLQLLKVFYPHRSHALFNQFKSWNRITIFSSSFTSWRSSFLSYSSDYWNYRWLFSSYKICVLLIQTMIKVSAKFLVMKFFEDFCSIQKRYFICLLE